jgi:hypothetical protein
MEGLNQALIDCVKAAGGSAIVGKKLFPEKSPEAAQRALLDCLNEERPAKLSPDQVVLVLRLARAKGYHGGIAHILADLGYSPTTPIEPKDEVAELQRQFIEAADRIVDATAQAEKLAQRIGALQPTLKAVA